jgi:CRP-like cAMP-binding protein
MTEPLIATFRKKNVHIWRGEISEAVAARGVLRAYSRREIIFNQGMPSKAVYAVKSGLIETSELNASGRQVTLSIRGPGQPFGYSEAVLDTPRTRQASVLQDAEIWELRTSDFMDMLPGRPDLILAMLGSVLARTTKSSEMRADLRGTSARSRDLRAVTTRHEHGRSRQGRDPAIADHPRGNQPGVRPQPPDGHHHPR